MSNQRQFLLGIFFLTALSILGFYTLFLTDFTLFKDPVTIEVHFPEAHGLREGDAVTVAGFRIGRVKSLSYSRNAPRESRIQALLTMNEPIQMSEGGRITIRESTFLGGRHIDIEPGPPGARDWKPNDEGAYLGSVEPNPIKALGSIGDILKDNEDSISGILEDIHGIVASARAGRGTVGRFLTDETMAEDLAVSVSELRSVAANMRVMTSDINSGQGLIGRLIHDETMVATVNNTLDNLETISADLREGRGIAGRLITDDALADEVARAIRSISATFDRIDRGEGALGMLLSDPELAGRLGAIMTNLDQASSDIAVVAGTIRSGEGTVGKLVMSPELYDYALDGVKLITRSLEDFREQAPVTAFTNVLFGAF